MPQPYSRWKRPQHKRRCKASSRGGHQCRAYAKPGSQHCHVHDGCACRPPRTHRNCASCGTTGPGTHVCGSCSESSIEGPVIRGTERRRCDWHAPAW